MQAVETQLRTRSKTPSRYILGRRDPRKAIEQRLKRIEKRLDEDGNEHLAENERVFILERLSELRRSLSYPENQTRAAADLTADLAFFAMTSVAFAMQDLAWDLRLLDLEWAAFVRRTF